MSRPEPSLAVWVDRFVSASNAGDARDSLEALLDGLRQPHFPEDDEEPLWHNRDLLEALLHVLATGQHPKGLPLEDEGPSLVLRLYLALVPKQKTTSSSSIMVSLLNEPAPGRLIHCVLDVISDSQASPYSRVLALQLLQQAGTHAPSLTQSQLLEAPNGLHRLADVLKEDHDVPEQVRNEWILVAQHTIARWPSCAKVWIFAEVADALLLLVQREGGLPGGNVVVLDALELLDTLVVRADVALADLVWQSPVVAPRLLALLDLRQGIEFLHPSSVSQKKTMAKKSSKKAVDATEEDDLDAILASGRKKPQDSSDNDDKSSTVESVILPHLTASEEKVIYRVLSILGNLLAREETRPSLWKQHAALGSLLWELALVTPPPPHIKALCALPSAALQQAALETIALYWNDSTTLERLNGMDRLLYLVCTGGGGQIGWEEQLGLSQAALHVLRTTVSAETAFEVVMRTQAPPIDGEPTTTVLQKLLNTVVENIAIKDREKPQQPDLRRRRRRRLNLLGALGAVGFLMGSSTTSRELLLSIGSTTNLVEALLEFLETSNDELSNLAILRFLSEWMVETPTVVQAILVSHASTTTLSALWGSSSPQVSILTGFVLGLAMEYMEEDKEDRYGGWTRQSILGLISKRGVSQYTAGFATMEKLELPWKVCSLEWKLFWNWYMSQVRVIRRRVVQELTAGSDEAEDANDDQDESAGVPNSNNKAAIRSLNRLVAQQSQEIEELRASLGEAQARIESQTKQMDVWKRRVESNPTQLDDMLTEYTNKNAELSENMESLRKEWEERNGSLEAQLKARDEASSKLQEEMRSWQEREREAREELEMMRGEMEGLSSAYANLETEFNRQQGQITSSTTAAPTGEESDAHLGQQSEGEVSRQEPVSTSELEELRSENARLRNDARAADEWMAMAVQRMNDIGGQNVSLQQQVAALKQELETKGTAAVVAGTDTSALDAARSQFLTEQEQRKRLEERLQELEAQKASLEEQVLVLTENKADAESEAIDVDSIREELERERERGKNLEMELDSARKEVSSAMESLGTSKSDREEFERKLGSAEHDLNIARAEIVSLTEERRQREKAMSNVHAMEIELEALRTEKQNWLASAHSEMNNLHSIVHSQQEEVENLQNKLDSRVKEVDSLREKLAESKRALKEKQASTVTESQALQDSNQSLQQALDAMKQEFKNATARSQTEIESREDRIRELEHHLSQARLSAGHSTPPTDAAGFFASEPTTETRAADGVDPRDEELARLRSDNEAAQEWMSKAVEHNQMLAEQVAALTADKADLVRELDELQVGSQSDIERDLTNSVAVETASAIDLNVKLEKLQDELRNAMEEKQGAMQNAVKLEEKIAQMSAEQEIAAENIVTLRGAVEEKDKDVSELKLAVEGLRSEVRNEVEEKQAAIKKVEELESAVALISAEKATATDQIEVLKKELETTFRDRENVIQEARHADAEKIASLEAELRSAQLAYNTSQESLESAKADIERIRVDLRQSEGACVKLQADRDGEKASLAQVTVEANAIREENLYLKEQQDSQLTTIHELNGQISEMKTLSKKAEQKMASLDNEKQALEQQLLEYESSIAEAENELDRKSSELSVVLEEKEKLIQERCALVSQNEGLQSDFASLHEQITNLEKEVTTLRQERGDLAAQAANLEQLDLQLKAKDEALEIAENEVSRLRMDLTEVQEQSKNVVGQWSERASQLETTINELEEDLETQEKEASEAISQWTLRCSEFESRIAQLEVSLQSASSEKDELLRSVEESESRIIVLQNDLNAKEAALAATEKTLSEERSAHQSAADSLAAQIEEYRASAISASNEFQNLSSELSELKELQVSTGAAWHVRTSELESTIQELEKRLKDEQDEAATAIFHLETRCAAVEEERDHLHNEVRNLTGQRDSWESEQDALRDELAEAKTLAVTLEKEVILSRRELEDLGEQSEEVVGQWKERVNELEASVRELEEILEMQQEQATDAISQWESRCAALDEKASELEMELDASKAELVTSLQTVLETKENLLESSSFSLEKPISRRNSLENIGGDDNTGALIASLKSQLAEADEMLADALESLFTERNSWRTDFEELEECKQEIIRLNDQIAEMSKRAVEEDSAKNSHLEEQLVEVREKVIDLEALLEKERETCAALEKDLRELKVAKETVETELNTELRTVWQETEARASSYETQLRESELEHETLNRRLADVEMERSRMEDALENERLNEQHGIRKWKHELDSLVEEKSLLLQERNDLKAHVAQLQEELREANDTLQACVTDAAAEKAAEVATQELRGELEQLTHQMQRDREALSSEKEARARTEGELNSIKADLALLLSMDEGDLQISGHIKQMALKAADIVQTRERREIDELRKALERALQELESARDAEQKASEKAAVSRRQLSVCEKELVTLKSDLMFLTQTMEEIREAEATRKAALEYRISALEDDREMLRRLHADELENVRNELTHISMEKDRILHSLKESEKKNAALVYSTSKERRDDNGAATESELSRLRIEKAELLTALADEGSRAERRIREAVAAHAASVEADVILERELRTAAEAAVDEMKIEVERLREQLASRDAAVDIGVTDDSDKSQDRFDKTSECLRYEEEAKRLLAENRALLNKLDKEKSQANIQIADITEKLRVAQAKAHRKDRDISFKAEVEAEVTRLQAEVPPNESTDIQRSGWLVVERNPAEDEAEPGQPHLNASEAYDYIQQQKIAIQEERAMYLELLAEHDDLLALLAQQDLERSSLQCALREAAGSEAVDEAIREAEENAVKQYGKYVQLH